MKKFIFLMIVVCLSKYGFSQSPDDVLQNAWFIPEGTARSLSIGGAVGALGGDISSMYVNPAGLGMYKTREFVLSPSFLINNNKSDFRGIKTSGINKSSFQLGTTGIVFGGKMQDQNRSSSFAVTFNQLANYDNKIHYSGINDYSSYSEQFLEELVNNNADVTSALNDYPFGSSLAFYTYLIDSTNDAQGNLTGYKSLVPVGNGNSISQDYDETTKGGLYELSFGFASNSSDRLFLGASINVPFSFYTQDISYNENDISGDDNNDFGYSSFSSHHKLNGAGLNARLGLIYRFENSLRLGFAFHTPSYMSYTDNLNAQMTTNTEGYAGTISAKSSDFSNAASETQYDEVTPYRFVASASYVLHEVENVNMQKGFLSADVEFVNYRGSRFRSQKDDDGYSAPGEDDYYNSLNDVIKSYYKGAFNLRIGGELKFSPIAVRLGAAYYGSPYKDNTLKANRAMVSGGVGYRNQGFFVDLTLAEMFNKDVSFPYRLSDKANTFAQLKNQRTNVLLSFGVKF